MFSNLSDPIRRAIRTFAQTFVGLFLISTAGWLAALVTWAQCSTSSCAAFPSLTPLGRAAVAAGAAAAVALVSFVQNYLEDSTLPLPPVLK